MFRISRAALDFLQRKRRAAGRPPTHGIRVYEQAAAGDGDKPRLAMAFVAGPREGDRCVERHGTLFFLDPAVDADLEDVLVDAAARRTSPMGLFTREG